MPNRFLNNGYFAGKVGIGTITPSASLQVAGKIVMSDGALYPLTIDHDSTTSTNKITSAGGLNIVAGYNNLISFKDATDTNMTISGYDGNVIMGYNSGKVGIGTTSPSYKLDVDGVIRGEQYLRLADTGGTNRFSIRAESTYGTLDMGSLAFNYIANAHLFLRGSSEIMRIHSNNNVGIGTNSPGAKLQIGSATYAPNANLGNNLLQIKSASGFAYLTIGNGDTANATSYIGGASGFTVIGSVADAGTLSEHMRITNTGNVGIGDASPTSISANTFSLSVSSSRSDLSGALISKANGTVKHQQYWDSSGYSFNLSANSGNFKFTGGNVGIGTTSPGQKLSISSNSSDQTDVSIGNTGNGVSRLYIDASNGDVSGSDYIWFGQNNDLTSEIQITQNAGSFNLKSTPSGSTQTNFTMTQAGNIGIGTTSPAEKLTVSGDANVTEKFAVGIAAVHPTIDFYNQGTAYFNGSTTVDDNLIVTNGNVGIGTTAPGAKLEVNGSTKIIGSLLLYQGSTSNQYLNISQSFNSTFINTGTSGETIFIGAPSAYQSNLQLQGDFIVRGGSSSTSIQTKTPLNVITNKIVDSGSSYFNAGNVGIGTTSPGAKLDIFNTGGSAGTLANCQTYSALTIKPYSSVDSKLTFSANGVSTQLIQATNNAGTTGRQISLQPFSGNVGVGVTLPSEKLEVNGHVKAVDGYKGYVSYFHNAGFFHSPRSSDGANPLFIPINSTAMSSSDQYYNTWVPLYAGRVRKIILKHISGSTPVATVCTFYKRINGTTSGTTYAGTVTGGGGVGMKVTYDFGTSNFTFNAEDEVQIGVVTGVATQPRMGGMSCQIWYEYNIT